MHSRKDSGEKSDRGLSQKPETPTDLTAKCRREQSKWLDARALRVYWLMSAVLWT